MPRGKRWRYNTAETTGTYAENMTRRRTGPIAAARHGAEVVLIDRYGFLGGLATAGLIAPILGHTASKSSRPVVEGDYTLTGDDVHQGRKFHDGIARGSYWIDIHGPLGKVYPVDLRTTDCIEQGKYPFWTAEHDKSMFALDALYPPGDDWHDIPYRSLTAKSLNNLLISGRCISATHEAMSAFRVMGASMAIGQAAGTAAALAGRKDGNVRDIHTSLLRETLIQDGALV